MLNQKHNGEGFKITDCSTPEDPIEFDFLGLVTPGIKVFNLDPFMAFTLPPPPHCNLTSLTPLGRGLIREMMRKKMIIDIDHMSKPMVNEVLAIAEAVPYPLVSGHTGFLDISKGHWRSEAQMTASTLERVRNLGGMIAPILKQGATENLQNTALPNDCSNSSKSWASAYLYSVQRMKGGPVGFGTDFHAFFGSPSPRFGNEACQKRPADGQGQTGPITYPFKVVGREGIDFWNAGQSMAESVVGEKQFNVNEDGLAHVGMLPDFFEDVKGMLGGSEIPLYPLLRSAEGYIRMWERIESTQVQ